MMVSRRSVHLDVTINLMRITTYQIGAKNAGASTSEVEGLFASVEGQKSGSALQRSFRKADSKRERERTVCLPIPDEEPVIKAVRPARLREGGSDFAKLANDMAEEQWSSGQDG